MNKYKVNIDLNVSDSIIPGSLRLSEALLSHCRKTGMSKNILVHLI